jgi:hypothetical protein
VAAAVGVGLTAGFWPGKRSAASQRPADQLAQGAGPADLGRAGPAAFPSLPTGDAAPPSGAGTLPSPSSAAVPPTPSIGARDLLLLGQSDPDGADARYRGRVVRVRGELAPPPAGAGEGYAAGLLTFWAGEVPPAVYPEPLLSRAGVLLRAEPSRQTDFRALPAGAAVEVEGRCAGWRPDPSTYLGAVVVLEDCRLVPRPKE